MTWTELLSDLSGKPIVFMATATTGLSAKKDKLLAVSYEKVYSDGRPNGTGMYVQWLTREDVMQAAQYHKFTPEAVSSTGMCAKDLANSLAELFRDSVVFSFNPRFQVEFLYCLMGSRTPFVHDLPLFLKGAEMQLVMDEKELLSIEAIEKFFLNRLGKTPSMKVMCQGRGIATDALFDQLPVKYNVACLKCLWKLLSGISVQVQASLL